MISDPGGEPGETGGGPWPPGSSTGPGIPTDCLRRPVGESELRTLGRDEYDNAVRDLTGVDIGAAQAFPSDVALTGFSAGIPVTELAVDHFASAAEAIAAQAVLDLGRLVPCDLATEWDACVREAIVRLGRRAYRRPLADDEVSSYQALYAEAASRYDAATGFELVLQTMLMSPHFLYRIELGVPEDGSDSQSLTAFELASRLSFFLFRTIPDDELLDAAEAGLLDVEEGYRAVVEQMLDDDRAIATIEDFHVQWLGLTELDTLEKDPSVQAGFDDAFRDAMLRETVTFADYVIRRSDGRLSTLLTAPLSFPEGPLVELYGLDPSAMPPAGEPVELAPGERAGILTHPSVLATHSFATHSSPIHRGVFVRTNVLCRPPPPPPADVPDLPPADPTQTGRDRFAAHSSDPACQPCHALIDPIGFAFEHYDAVGRFREEEAAAPIDASGELVEAGDASGPFGDAVDLVARLADSNQVRQCVGTQWFRYALGRLDSAADRCALEQVERVFDDSDGDLRELLLAIAMSDSFRRRATASPEAS